MSEPRKKTKSADGRIHQHVIDVFHKAFLARYQTKPSWGAKQGAIVKRLIRAHGADEVAKRIAAMFSNAIAWPPHPRTLDTLSVHFDKFIVVEQPITAAEAWAQVSGLMSRVGKSADHTKLDAKVRMAIAGSGGWYHLCSIRGESARYAFLAAFNLAGK